MARMVPPENDSKKQYTLQQVQIKYCIDNNNNNKYTAAIDVLFIFFYFYWNSADRKTLIGPSPSHYTELRRRSRANKKRKKKKNHLFGVQSTRCCRGAYTRDKNHSSHEITKTSGQRRRNRRGR